MFIKFKNENLEQMMNRLENAMSPVGIAVFLNTVMTPYLQGRAKQRFANEGDDVVGKWFPLTPATASYRENQGYPAEHPINHRTGRLERYITQSPSRVAIFPGGALLTFPGTPPTGDLIEKLQTAQEGKSRPYTPPRPVLGINERDIAFGVYALEQHISRAARGTL